MVEYKPEVGLTRCAFIPAATDDILLLFVAQVEIENGLTVFAFFTEKLRSEIQVLSLNSDEFFGFVFKGKKTRNIL